MWMRSSVWTYLVSWDVDEMMCAGGVFELGGRIEGFWELRPGFFFSIYNYVKLVMSASI